MPANSGPGPEEAMGLHLTLGGDGTVHEVVNGLLAEGAQPSVPVLGTVPGGSANASRPSLGFPQDAVRSTGLLLRAMRDGHRTIGLDRWTTLLHVYHRWDCPTPRSWRMEQARATGRRDPHPIFATTVRRSSPAATKQPALLLHRGGGR